MDGHPQLPKTSCFRHLILPASCDEYFMHRSATVFSKSVLLEASLGSCVWSSYLLLRLLLSCFRHVRPCATPRTAAPQAPPSLGLSRQEHWSGLPLPSPMHACLLHCFSCVQLCATVWTGARQAPLSTGISRQEYWSGLPFLSPR